MKSPPRMPSRIVLILLVAVLLACGGAEDDPTSIHRTHSVEIWDGWERQDDGVLRVRVVDAVSGTPLPRAVVILSDARQVTEKKVSKADAHGMAEFPALPPGTGYAVLVAEPGYLAINREGIWVKPAQVRVVTLPLSSEIGVDERIVDHPFVELPKGEMRVRVVDGVDGLPLPGASVVLTHAKIDLPEADSTADIDGLVYFRALPPRGGYVVRVTMAGYTAGRIDELRVRVGQIQTLVIVLGEDETSHGLYPATTASVSGFGRPAGALGRARPSVTY